MLSASVEAYSNSSFSWHAWLKVAQPGQMVGQGWQNVIGVLGCHEQTHLGWGQLSDSQLGQHQALLWECGPSFLKY